VLDAFTFLVMLPRHALEAIAPADLVQSDWWRTNPIGTGPFKWSQHKPGEYVELVAYDDYWRGRPKLDKIINRFFPEAGSSVIALRSGEIQFTYLSTDEALALEGNPDITVLSGPSQVVNVLGFDMTDPRFQDVRVRQAFMYAIDRQAIVDQLYQGQATLVPCAYVLDKYLPADANAYAPDPEMARSLLQEAGWDSSKPVEEVTYYTDQLSTDVLVTIQQMLADVDRAQIYQQVCKVMNEQVYWAPMWVTTRFGGASTKIGNFVWTPAPGGGRFYDAAESWTIAA
jgi:peptide/nickel transport system substrate-binding protein